MKNIVLLSIIVILSCGSCCKRFYTASVQDSVRIETRYEYIERVRDTTVYVPVPHEVEKIVTRDTVSHLSNSVAYSDAVVSGGFLYHSLINKSVSLPAVVQVKEVEVVRDSIVYKDRVEVKIQEVNRLTWWNKIWIYTGQVLSMLLGIVILAIVMYRLAIKKL